jgi:hypothetical protein
VGAVRRLSLLALMIAALAQAGCSFFFRSSSHVGGDAGADAATDAGPADAG